MAAVLKKINGFSCFKELGGFFIYLKPRGILADSTDIRNYKQLRSSGFFYFLCSLAFYFSNRNFENVTATRGFLKEMVHLDPKSSLNGLLIPSRFSIVASVSVLASKMYHSNCLTCCYQFAIFHLFEPVYLCCAP